MSIFRRHQAGGLNPPATNRIIATYNVTSTSSATQLLGSSDSFNLDLVALMFIDGLYITPAKTYTFSTTGNHTVIFGFKSITSCTYMFSGCSTLIAVDLSGFDAKDVTTMSYMFYNCSKLTSINFEHIRHDDIYGFSKLQTNMLKVTTTASMFRGCSSLTDVTGLDEVFLALNGVNTNCSYMFYGCSSLVSIDLSYFVTSSVTSLASMFLSCSKLTTVITTGWDASKVSNMASMFRDCIGLTSAVNIGHLDWGLTTALTVITRLFNGCTSFTTWSYPANVIKSGVTNMSYLLDGCTAFTTTSLGGDTTSVTNMSYAFRNCSNLTSLDVVNWNWSKVTTTSNMFSGCTKLTSLKVGNYYPTSAPTRTSMFASITTSGKIILPSNSTIYNGWYNNVFNGYKPSSWTYLSY